jgi:hypothetical protein
MGDVDFAAFMAEIDSMPIAHSEEECQLASSLCLQFLLHTHTLRSQVEKYIESQQREDGRC